MAMRSNESGQIVLDAPTPRDLIDLLREEIGAFSGDDLQELVELAGEAFGDYLESLPPEAAENLAYKLKEIGDEHWGRQIDRMASLKETIEQSGS